MHSCVLAITFESQSRYEIQIQIFRIYNPGAKPGHITSKPGLIYKTLGILKPGQEKLKPGQKKLKPGQECPIFFWGIHHRPKILYHFDFEIRDKQSIKIINFVIHRG